MEDRNEVLLSVRNINKTYKGGKKANSNISVDILSGEIHGVLGPNGAGKTTLIRQICGLLKPDEGEILYKGYDILKDTRVIPHIMASMGQMVYAQRALKVSEFIIFTGIYRGLSKAEAEEEMKTLIAYFGIDNLQGRLMSNLSGGESRIVCFIAAVIGHRELVILDEPTNDMDPEKRILLWTYVKKLRDEKKTTFILVTHNIYEAQDVVDRVSVILNGKLVLCEKPRDIINRFGGRLSITFSLPYNVNIPEKIVSLLGIVCVDQENYSVNVSENELNMTLNKLFEWEDSKFIKNIDIKKPSLSDAYILSLDLERKDSHGRNS